MVESLKPILAVSKKSLSKNSLKMLGNMSLFLNLASAIACSSFNFGLTLGLDRPYPVKKNTILLKIKRGKLKKGKLKYLMSLIFCETIK